MGCASGRPIATQLGAGMTACDIVGSTNPDIEEVTLQFQRTINYLEGHPATEVAVGGMIYVDIKGAYGKSTGLGHGIIPDLKKAQDGGTTLDPEVAKYALRVAEAALDQAKRGLKVAEKGDFEKSHKSARIVASLLKGAFEMVLA